MRRYQQIASKALKTMILQKNMDLRRYIPHTEWFDFHTLDTMMERFSVVYIKPDKGGGGTGIIRVKRMDQDQYQISNLRKSRVINKRKVSFLLKHLIRPEKRYIIQQGIELSTVDGHPFDLRLLLQKPRDQWKITGLIAKVASPGKIVTNYCKGGKPYSAFHALLEACSFEREKTQDVLHELYQLGFDVANKLNHRFKGLKELGIDIGIDRERNIWIFEVNTRPQFNMFRKLKNLQMYNQIKRYHKAIIK